MIHFLTPLTMNFLPSGESTASVERFLTSEPASGSVMARQTRFWPERISGRTRSWSSCEPKW